ncbi:MAG: hypothetical protein MJ239_03825 [Bacilli bacterium]|nr:hypothetical protein [Bacilli bacterium]
MVWTLVISITSLLAMIVLVALSSTKVLKHVKFPLYLIPLVVGAILLCSFGFASIDGIKDAFISTSPVNPLKILALFISMAFLSIYLDELGFFSFLAHKAVGITKGGQLPLFLILYALITVLTIFTSNDIIILTFTPFLAHFCKRAKISPLPYLFGEFIAANTWSMLFIIGNPTNIYLGTFANIAFFEYFKTMAIPTLFAGTVSFLFILLLFRKKLKEPLDPSLEEVEPIKEKTSLIINLICLSVCVVMLAISSYIGIEMVYVSVGAFLVLLIAEMIHGIVSKRCFAHIGHSFKRLPYQVIPLLISMFVIVLSLKEQGISSHFASFLSQGDSIWMYGTFSTLFCNLMNNIPMSVFFASLCTNETQIYASVIGSNIGAFLTPLGALAGIMFVSLCRKENIEVSFFQFSKVGCLVAIPTLVAALLGLMIVA